MLAATVRSGLVESTHPWSGAVVDADGAVLGRWGEPDTPLFYRSAIKAIQAAVSQEAGAGLPPVQLALASASHAGTPAHIALVESILSDGGLDASDLQCPPSWPRSSRARRRVEQAGGSPSRLLHNCSGKHAGFLRACVAAGWPTATYLDPDHPLQARVTDLVADLSGLDPRPVGIDGCGAPTLRGTVAGLARAFARLSREPRFAEVATASQRYPALTAGNDLPDGRFAMWWGGVAKCGAEGIMVAARNGVAIATKSHEGSLSVAVQACIEVGRRSGLLPVAGLDDLADLHHPPIYGGGREVGRRIPDLAAAETPA